MTPEKTIRMQARKKLADNNWTAAVGATFILLTAIMLALYGAFCIDSGIDLLLENLGITLGSIEDDFSKYDFFAYALLFPFIIMLIPLFVGYLRYFYLMTKDSKTSLGELFYYSGKRYFKALGKGISFIVRNLWKILLAFLPYYLTDAIVTGLTIDKVENMEALAFWEILCYLIVYALLFSGILLCMKLCLNSFLYFFLWFENENLSSNQLLETSRLYMQNFRDRVMKLFSSVFPWLLTGLLVIPLGFVMPYVAATMATSAKWIIALYSEPEEASDTEISQEDALTDGYEADDVSDKVTDEESAHSIAVEDSQDTISDDSVDNIPKSTADNFTDSDKKNEDEC